MVHSITEDEKTGLQYNGAHYWKIREAEYPLNKVINDIQNGEFIITTRRKVFEEHYHVFEMFYHRFFILKKKMRQRKRSSYLCVKPSKKEIVNGEKLKLIRLAKRNILQDIIHYIGSYSKRRNYEELDMPNELAQNGYKVFLERFTSKKIGEIVKDVLIKVIGK